MKTIFKTLFLTSLLTGSIQAMAQAQSEPETQPALVIEYSTAVYDFSSEQKKLILEGPISISDNNMKILCDYAEVYSSRKEASSENTSSETETAPGTIDYILATGNVDISQLGTRALAGKAEIFPEERKLVLEDNPRIIDENGTVSGYRIVFLQGSRQIRIDPGESKQRNRIQLNNIKEMEFLMGNTPPATATTESE